MALKRLLRSTSAIAVGTWLSTFGVFLSHGAAQSPLIEASGRAPSATYQITPGANLSQPIYFYYVSKGNQTRVVELTLEGPAGVGATVEVAPLKGTAQQTASLMRGSYQMQLQRPLRVAGSSAASTIAPYGLPGGCTQEEYDLYLALIESTPELAGITPEQFCAAGGGVTPPGGGEVPPGQTGNTDVELGLLRKNACGNRNTRYIVRMKVDASRVDPAAISSGAVIRAGFKERVFNGPTAASIKPRSDGMFAPNPLLLMSSISAYGEVLTQTRWSANGIQAITPVRIENYVFYRNLILTRSVITNLLTGRGKATFDLTDGQRAYSVCFRMKRTRQNRNGYPGGDDNS